MDSFQKLLYDVASSYDQKNINFSKFNKQKDGKMDEWMGVFGVFEESSGTPNHTCIEKTCQDSKFVCGNVSLLITKISRVLFGEQ